MTVGFLALSAASFVAGQPPPATPDTAAQGRKLVGTWKLNADESEKFSEKMRQARGGERGARPDGGRPDGSGGSGFGGGRRGGRGGGGMRGQPGSGGAPDDRRESMRRLAEPSEVLTIKTEGDTVLVADDTGTIRRIHPDGRTMKTDNGEGQVRSRWVGAELVAETVPARGPRYKETFALSPDRRRLLVTIHLEPPMGGAVDVRRVYDAAP